MRGFRLCSGCLVCAYAGMGVQCKKDKGFEGERLLSCSSSPGFRYEVGLSCSSSADFAR